jgi:hypothetical protein
VVLCEHPIPDYKVRKPHLVCFACKKHLPCGNILLKSVRRLCHKHWMNGTPKYSPRILVDLSEIG